MTKVTAPLLAFTARGRIGRTVVATRRTGNSIIQPYVVPSNPNTPAQAAQRSAFSVVAAHWNLPETHPDNHPAWTRTAKRSLKPVTGYNAFLKNALPCYAQDPASAFVDSLYPTAPLTASATLLALNAESPPFEEGDFHLWSGPTPQTMIYMESQQQMYGTWAGIVELGQHNDIVYVQLRKADYDRSGIYKITLTLY